MLRTVVAVLVVLLGLQVAVHDYAWREVRRQKSVNFLRWATELPAQESCDRYASPTGTGDGLTPQTPYKIQSFWGQVSAIVRRLCLLDDTSYTGAASMIVPPAGLSGAGGNPIVIRALNDGAVTLDGQFARRPVNFFENSWFVLEGINAKNGVQDVVFLNNSHNNIIRRGVFWDTDIRVKRDVFGITASSDNLFEDIGLFGTGRKVSGPPFDGSHRNTYRRVWERWEGNTTGFDQNKFGMSVNYGTTNSSNLFENLLVTWTGESQPQEWDATNNDGTPIVPTERRTNFNLDGSKWVMGRDRMGGTFCHNGKVLGSLVYLGPTIIAPPGSNLSRLQGIGSDSASNADKIASCWTYKDVLLAVHPSNPNSGSVPGFFFGNTGTGNSATFLSAFGAESNVVASSWNPANNVFAASLAALVAAGADPWAGATGANLCKRYVNGVKTDEPLWPWPMNERIKAATAAAGRYTGPCVNCLWAGGATQAPLRTATDVMAEVQALLGTIPAGCRTPTAPPPTTFPTTALLDNADRADGDPGANWVDVVGLGLVIATNQFAPTDTAFHVSRWATSFSANQEAWATIKALASDGGSTIFLGLRVQDVNNRYQAKVGRVTGADNDTVTIEKFVAGTGTSLSTFALGFDAAVNDQFGARMVDQTIEVWYKRAAGVWTFIGQVNDNDLQVAGFIALGLRDVARADDFGGGVVGSAGGGTPSPRPPVTAAPTATDRPATTCRLPVGAAPGTPCVP